MNHQKWWGKALGTLGIVLMGITAAFTIMSGAGTTCVALAAEKFGESMAPIAPYSWLYILFVLVTTAIGVMGVRATYLLIKGKPDAYRDAVVSLILGIVIGTIHMIVSRALRGKSMPTDGVVYTTMLTLIVFLILRIPAIWKEVNYGRSGDKSMVRNAAAMTLTLCGMITLTTPFWGAPSHVFVPGGFNWANAWSLQLNLIGILLCISGTGLFAVPAIKKAYSLKNPTSGMGTRSMEVHQKQSQI